MSMDKLYYDFWYLKSEEIELDGRETDRMSYEVGIEVYADIDHFKLLDDIRITGLDRDEMLLFNIDKPELLFPKLEEEGLYNIVEDIEKTGSYSVMGDTVITLKF